MGVGTAPARRRRVPSRRASLCAKPRLDSDGTPPAARKQAGIKSAKIVIANHSHRCIVMAASTLKGKSRSKPDQ
jgi:hypothetical protein